MTTRYGRQPIRSLLSRRGWTVTRLALHLGMSARTLSRPLLGECAPSNVLREKLPDLLSTPLDQLFTPESLRGTFHEDHTRHDLLVPDQGSTPRVPASELSRAQLEKDS